MFFFARYGKVWDEDAFNEKDALFHVLILLTESCRLL